MKKFLIFTCCFLAACGQQLSIGGGGGSNPAVNYACPSGGNVMTVTVNGSQCNSGTMYVNEPCASVTICPVGLLTNCQTINNILVDTGSYGLRVFASLISAPLRAGFTTPAGNVAECAQFGSGRTWGQVMNADLYLAGEPKASVPIQLIDNTYSGGDATLCAGSDASPSTAGYSGILGVGLFNADCGANCTGATPEPTYFSCNGATCSKTVSGACSAAWPSIGYCGTSVISTNQVSNPIPNISGPLVGGTGMTDSNGSVMFLAAANSGGNLADNGCLVFGVNTQANNIPPATATVYPANGSAEFTVKVGGVSYGQSFIDSGSNAIYAPSNLGLTNCSGWYCPANTTTENITINTIASSFIVANANTLFNTSNYIFNDLSGNISAGTIDLGINYFYGRAIWVGVENQQAVINGTTYNTLNANNLDGYWAY